MSRSHPRLRPTTHKVLEALLQILHGMLGSLQGRRVLDLFAGLGQFGLEAAAAGAASVVFVESDARTAAELRQRLRATGLSGKVLQGDVRVVLRRLQEPFDLIFLDPPYSTPLAAETLNLIAQGGLLAAGGIVVAEHHHKDDVPECVPPLWRVRQQRYGETAVSFYKEQ